MSQVSVIVISTDEGRWLDPCLRSLGRNAPHAEVIVVDNACTDDTADVLRAHPEVSIVRSIRRLGFAAANNLGAQRVLDPSAHLFFLNADTWCPPGTIQELGRFLDRSADHGAIGPFQVAYSGEPLEHPEMSPLNDWSTAALDRGPAHPLADWDCRLPNAASEPWAQEAVIDVHYVQGAALMVRGDVFGRLGGFDDWYETFYEELDLCRRIQADGYRVGLHRGYRIGHHGGGGTARSDYRSFHMTRNKYFFLATDATIPGGRAISVARRWVLNDALIALGCREPDVEPIDVRLLARVAASMVRAVPHVRRRRSIARRRETRPRVVHLAPLAGGGGLVEYVGWLTAHDPRSTLRSVEGRDPRSIVSAAWTVRRHAPEIVHAHETAALISGWLATRGTPSSLVASFHGCELDRLPYFVDVVRRAKAELIVPSTAFASIFVEGGVDPRRVHVLPYGLPPQSSIRTAERGDGLAFFGRLEEQKGVEFLIAALCRLRDRGIEPTVEIIGDGSLEGGLRDTARRARLSSVTFHGRSSDADGVLRRAGCLVLPSLWEGLPIVMLRALRSGCPVIVSDLPGLADIAGSGGCVFPPGDVRALADLLERFWTDPVERDRLLKGAQSVSSRPHLTLEDHIDRLRSIHAVARRSR